ncbi:excalibur calcium-binding domain-containing protein [Blastococcus atacamensis]|uniref:excalibur calcium-binding domain-containing protein n=1 Tax=Blastococcus atacamensis TaxID=2070508 RepID=UPI0018E49E28|nr:excalibur calcium-binding domain-containing protein [Blastococcus atacamensis]
MSKRFRTPLTLCAAAALLFVGPGLAAAAEEGAAGGLPSETVTGIVGDAAAGEGSGEASDESGQTGADDQLSGGSGESGQTGGDSTQTGDEGGQLSGLGGQLSGEGTQTDDGNTQTGDETTQTGDETTQTGDEGTQTDDGDNPVVDGCNQLVEGITGIDPTLGGELEQLCTGLEGGAEELVAGCEMFADEARSGSPELGAVIDELCKALGGDGNEETGGENVGGGTDGHEEAAPAVHYTDCDDARARGAAPVHSGQPGYGPHLDNDNDGVGCEQETALVSHTPTAAPQLAYTGFDTLPFAGAGAALLVLGSAAVAAARRRS